MQSYSYVELLLIDNFLITIVLFLFSSAILRFKINKHLMLLSGLFSAVINLGVPLLNLNGFLNLAFKISLGFVLCFLCCLNKTNKEQIKFFLVFMISTCLFGGVYFFAYYSVFLPLKLQDFPIGFFALIIFVLSKIMFKFVRKYLSLPFNDCLYFCEVIIGKKKIKFNAFLDTGNLLIDTQNQKPVAVLEIEVLKQVLKKDEIANLIKKDFSKSTLTEPHSIDYKTIEGKAKQLIVFSPDKFIVHLKQGKKEVDCYLGISLLPLFKNQNFQAIIGLKIAQGV